MPSLVDLLGVDPQAPPAITYLGPAVGLTTPSFLTRNTLSLGVQVWLKLLPSFLICFMHWSVQIKLGYLYSLVHV